MEHDPICPQLQSQQLTAETMERTHMTDTSWPSAFSCPECLEYGGRALNVKPHSPGKILADVRCKECGHEWQLVRDIPNYAIRRKEDRRQRPRSFSPIVTLN
jgi:hypothetical protein